MCYIYFFLSPELQFLLPFPTAVFRIKGAWTIVFSVILLFFDKVLVIISLEVFNAVVISFTDLFLRNSKIIVVGNCHVSDLSRF